MSVQEIEKWKNDLTNIEERAKESDMQAERKRVKLEFQKEVAKREKRDGEFEKSNPKPDGKVCKKHGPYGEWTVSYCRTEGDRNGDGHWEYSCEGCPECKKNLEFLNNLDIPERFWDVKSDDKYIKDVLNGGILFTGGVGTGKTHAIVALIKGLANSKGNFSECRFDDIGSITRCLRDSIANGSYEQVYERYLNRRVLIMDDLGTENITDFLKEFFHNIVNDRYNSMRPIVASTNLNSKELSERYGERVYSRLLDMCRVVKLKGKDRRSKK